MGHGQSREFWQGRNDRGKQQEHERKGHDQKSLLRPWSLFQMPCHYRPPTKDKIGKADYNRGWKSRG